VSISLTDDQRALADLVRSWAARTEPVRAVRAGEDDPEAWRAGWADLAQLELVHLAAPQSAGGGGARVADLAAVLEEAAAQLVAGPVLPTALAGLLLAAAGRACPDLGAVALEPGELTGSEADGTIRLSGSIGPVLGATAGATIVLPDQDGRWYAVDTADPGVKLLELTAADFSRPLAEVRLTAAGAEPLPGLTTERVRDLAGYHRGSARLPGRGARDQRESRSRL